MRNRNKISLEMRLFALVLTTILTFSMSGFAFTEVFADIDADGAIPAEQIEGEEEGAEAEPEVTALGAPESEGETDAEELDAETDSAVIQEEPKEMEPKAGLNTKLIPQTTEIASINVRTAGEDGKITVVWSAVGGADHYIVSLEEGAGVNVNATASRSVVINADPSKKHTVLVRAYRVKTADEKTKDPDTADEPVLIAEGSCDNASAVSRNKIKLAGVNGKSLGINLKTLIGESYNGYAVCQGSCTDGTFAYYLMVSSSNQKGRILKTYAGSGTVAARSGVINVCHGNGMAFDKKNRRLVVVGRDGRRNELTVINADNLSSVSYPKVNYNTYNGAWRSSSDNGLSAISYVEKYNCFVALQRKTHEILILDLSFNVIGMVGTKITARYPGTYQAMDADERYVYLLLSEYTEKPSKQPYNRILVLDWNSENLLAIDENNKCISAKWMCNNDGSGIPDSDIIVNTKYEAESLYHVDQGNGTSRVYLAEYFNHPSYKKVTKIKKVKKKWKKVRKWYNKKTKKWTTKKPKKKYRGKSKKVWKYKKVKKKVKVKVVDHLNRENYVYDLGVF